MKTRKTLQSCIILLTAIIVFGSCKKESFGSKELLVYVAGDYGMVDNRVVVPFIHTPVSVNGNTMTGFAVSATREVPEDIVVTMSTDMTLVDKFNQQYGKTYLPLSGANYRILNPGKFTIKAGTLQSDSIKIEILNPAQLTDPKGYLLPLSIAQLEGKDQGATISTNQRTVYINVTYEFNNIAANEIPLTGTALSRAGWTVTVSSTQSGSPNTAMLDGNNATAWRSSSTTSAKYAILNTGSLQTIKGFLIVPNYVTTTENPTQMTISTSTDNVTYKVQGIWKGTGPASGSSAVSPDIKGVNFIAAVQAQYFRFDFTAQVSGNRVGIGELNAVQ